MLKVIKKHRIGIIGLLLVSVLMIVSACDRNDSSGQLEKAATETENVEKAATETEEVDSDLDNNENMTNEISKQEAKKIVEELMLGITNTFSHSYEKYNWNNYDNPADFSILRPEFLEYSSESFTDGFLKETASVYYCECDQPFFPDTNLDVRFTLQESSDEKFTASGIEFVNDMGNGGNTVYYTVVKENGKWVLDDLKWVPYDEEPLNVTREEVEAYFEEYTQVQLVNETTYNGQKIYIVRFPEYNGLQGIYADSTEILYEVPSELLPSELKPGSVSGGTEDAQDLDVEQTPQGVSPEQAEQIIREELQVPDSTSVVYDHEDGDNYIIHVYDVVEDDVSSHNATRGWYAVNKNTGNWFDYMNSF